MIVYLVTSSFFTDTAVQTNKSLSIPISLTSFLRTKKILKPVINQSINSNFTIIINIMIITWHPETWVTIVRHDKKQDLGIIIPTYVVPRKLMQKYNTLIYCSNLETKLLPYFLHISISQYVWFASRKSFAHRLIDKLENFPIGWEDATSLNYRYVNICVLLLVTLLC